MSILPRHGGASAGPIAKVLGVRGRRPQATGLPNQGQAGSEDFVLYSFSYFLDHRDTVSNWTKVQRMEPEGEVSPTQRCDPR